MTTQRRSLEEGLKGSLDRSIEEQFVYGKSKPESPSQPDAPVSDAAEGKAPSAAQVGRAPLTIRFRADYADALKRASLERQIAKKHPHFLQDILDEAIEPWLRQHGYIT
jgi:hypothetical protein